MIEDFIRSRSKRFILFWLFLVVPFLTFMALRHSLKLALFGDNWLQFWTIKFQFGEGKRFDPLGIRSYLGPYNPQYAILGILTWFFDYQPFPYYLVSMVFRILAAIGIYFIALEMTRSKLAGLIASAFFGVSAISLDTTSWVFNMNSYLGIIALAPFMVFLIRSRTQGWRKFFFSWTCFLLAAILVPVRMHGIFFIVFLSDLIWFLRNFKKKIFFQFSARQFVFGLGAVLLNRWQVFGELGSAYNYRWKDNLGFLSSAVLGGEKPELAFSPFAVVGNMVTSLVIRQKHGLADFLQTHLGASPTFALVWPLFFLFVLMVILTSFYLTKKKNLFLFWCLLSGFIWTLLNDACLASSLGSSFSRETLVSSLIGGYFSIVLVGFYLVFLDQKKFLADSLLFSLFWIYAFLLVPWFWEPASVFTAEHRYLITPGVGVALSLGCLFGIIDHLLLSKVGWLRSKVSLKAVHYGLGIMPTAVLSYLLLQNIAVSNSYFKKLVVARGAEVYQEVWDSLVDQVPDLDKENFSVFYFTSANTKGPELHEVLIFGFPVRVGIIYGIEDSFKLPATADNFKELVSFVTDGQAFKRYGYEQSPVPLERVYCFELKGSRLVDTRPEIHAKLRQIIAQKEAE